MMKIYYVMMIVGTILMFQMGSSSPYATYLTILGVVLMFIGISRISRSIPSKKNESEK